MSFLTSFSASKPGISLNEWSEAWCSGFCFHARQQLQWALGVFQAVLIIFQVLCLSASGISPSKAVRTFVAALSYQGKEYMSELDTINRDLKPNY